jgi:hypothetical protein
LRLAGKYKFPISHNSASFHCNLLSLTSSAMLPCQIMFRYCKLKIDLQHVEKGWKRCGAYNLGRVLEELALGAQALGNPDHHVPSSSDEDRTQAAQGKGWPPRPAVRGTVLFQHRMSRCANFRAALVQGRCCPSRTVLYSPAVRCEFPWKARARGGCQDPN